MPKDPDFEGRGPQRAADNGKATRLDRASNGAPRPKEDVTSMDRSTHEDCVRISDARADVRADLGAGSEVVRRATVRVLTERVELLGVDRSGAYEHYNLQLSRGFPIPRYEIAVLDLVKQHLPGLRSYHEIGSGLGTLPLMLAHDGFVAVGVERDERRHLTATTILRELAVSAPQIESNCRLIGAEFPDAVADLDVSESMAVLTDFVSTRSAKDYARLCEGLAQYRYVLMDLQRFCRKRDGKEEQQELVEQLASYGLSLTTETIDLGSEGYYRLFETRKVEVQEHALKTAGGSATTAAGIANEKGTLISQPTAGHLAIAQRIEPVKVPTSESTAPVPTLESRTPLKRYELPPMPRPLRRGRFGALALSALLVVGVPSLLATLYCGFWASNQYVTSFEFAVRGPSQGDARNSTTSQILGPSGMTPDAFVITDYINSRQAINDVGRGVDLRALYSSPDVDYWSRLAPNASLEELSEYWTSMVSAHFDLVSGNVSVSVRAFTPEDSLKLAQRLVETSDAMFQKLNTSAQRAFVRIADENLNRTQEKLETTRKELMAFREQSGLMVLDQSAQAGAAIVDDLRKQLVALQAQVASVWATSPTSPLLAVLKSQVAALEAQINNSSHPGTSPVKAVSPEAFSRYQTLDIERQFAEKLYADALALRNQAYVMAQNQQSFLALFVEPTLSQTSTYPKRIKAIASVVLIAAAAWFVGMLITYAVRDHLM